MATPESLGPEGLEPPTAPASEGSEPAVSSGGGPRPAPRPAGPSARGTTPPGGRARPPARPRPTFDRRIAGAAVAILVVGAVAGYLIGWSRGSAGLDDGASGTTYVIPNPAAAGSSGSDPTKVLSLPDVSTKTLSFATDGLPATYEGRPVLAPRGAWKVDGGALGPTENPGLPAGATKPRLFGEGPDVVFGTGRRVTLVEATLAAPTAYSGVIGAFVDGRNYWAALVDHGAKTVLLVEVKDGVESSRGFVGHVVTPGTKIGMLTTADGQITLLVDGKPQMLQTFFGNKPSVSAEGIQGQAVGLLAGEGSPTFTDLRFG